MDLTQNEDDIDDMTEEQKAAKFDTHTFFSILGKNKNDMLKPLGQFLQQDIQGKLLKQYISFVLVLNYTFY
jgi:hypothetical protein